MPIYEVEDDQTKEILGEVEAADDDEARAKGLPLKMAARQRRSVLEHMGKKSAEPSGPYAWTAPLENADYSKAMKEPGLWKGLAMGGQVFGTAAFPPAGAMGLTGRGLSAYAASQANTPGEAISSIVMEGLNSQKIAEILKRVPGLRGAAEVIQGKLDTAPKDLDWLLKTNWEKLQARGKNFARGFMGGLSEGATAAGIQQGIDQEPNVPGGATQALTAALLKGAGGASNTLRGRFNTGRGIFDEAQGAKQDAANELRVQMRDLGVAKAQKNAQLTAEEDAFKTAIRDINIKKSALNLSKTEKENEIAREVDALRSGKMSVLENKAEAADARNRARDLWTETQEKFARMTDTYGLHREQPVRLDKNLPRASIHELEDSVSKQILFNKLNSSLGRAMGSDKMPYKKFDELPDYDELNALHKEYSKAWNANSPDSELNAIAGKIKGVFAKSGQPMRDAVEEWNQIQIGSRGPRMDKLKEMLGLLSERDTLLKRAREIASSNPSLMAEKYNTKIADVTSSGKEAIGKMKEQVSQYGTQIAELEKKIQEIGRTKWMRQYDEATGLLDADISKISDEMEAMVKTYRGKVPGVGGTMQGPISNGIRGLLSQAATLAAPGSKIGSMALRMASYGTSPSLTTEGGVLPWLASAGEYGARGAGQIAAEARAIPVSQALTQEFREELRKKKEEEAKKRRNR